MRSLKCSGCNGGGKSEQEIFSVKEMFSPKLMQECNGKPMAMYYDADLGNALVKSFENQRQDNSRNLTNPIDSSWSTDLFSKDLSINFNSNKK